MADYREWVRTGQVVDAGYASGGGRYATGVVYGYVDRPTVLIRCADGSTTSWIADLCKPADDEGAHEHADRQQFFRDVAAERDTALWLLAEAKHKHAELLGQRDAWWDHIGREQSALQARIDAALATGSEDEQDDLTRALTAAESGEAYGWPIVADVLRREILRVRAALTTDPSA